MRSARLIFLVMDSADGIAWEAERLFALGLQDRLVLVFPPTGDVDADERWALAGRLLSEASPRCVRVAKPTSGRCLLWVAFPGTADEIILTADRSSEAAYDEALVLVAIRQGLSAAVRRADREHPEASSS